MLDPFLAKLIADALDRAEREHREFEVWLEVGKVVKLRESGHYTSCREGWIHPVGEIAWRQWPGAKLIYLAHPDGTGDVPE